VEAIAVGLVLLSAVFHATWNLLAKRSANPLAFFWAFSLVGLALYALPAGVAFARHGLPGEGVPFVLVSGTLEAGYFVSLAAAYKYGALSLTYPVARGTGVLLVPLLAIPIFAERPTLVAWAGIGLILTGLMTINVLGARGRVAEELEHGRRGLVFAVLTGLVISSYSLVDKAGVARVHPLVYLYGIFIIEFLWVTPYVLARHRGAVWHELRANRHAVLIGGVLNLGTYLIVLAALRVGGNVGYVVPLRETGIVFATLFGVFLLKEHIGRVRIAGCGLVAAGVLAIALGG
jgi:drug/metabolite transporter (DMT)-like permease